MVAHHGQDAPVLVVVDGDAERFVDAGGVHDDGLRGRCAAVGDGGVVEALGDQRETSGGGGSRSRGPRRR
jgi:hypothetical protein